MLIVVITFWLALPLLAAVASFITGSQGAITFFIFLTGGGLLAGYQIILSILIKAAQIRASVSQRFLEFCIGFLAVFSPLMVYGIFYTLPTDSDAPIRIDGPDPSKGELLSWRNAAGVHYFVMTILIIVCAYAVGQLLRNRNKSSLSNLFLANLIWIISSIFLIAFKMAQS